VGEIKWGERVNAVAGANREVVGSKAGDVGIDRFSRAVIGDELVLSWPAVQMQPAEDLGYSTTDLSSVFYSPPRVSMDSSWTPHSPHRLLMEST
jgi:hypothetical protein